MNESFLLITEVFHPEDFLVNDLVFEWARKGYNIEVLTRTPSYPFGKTLKGYKNKIYQKSIIDGVKIHRIPIISGYSKNTFLKILNYFFFVFWGSIVAVIIGKRYDKVFVYQTGPLTVAFPGVVLKKVYGKKLMLYTQDIWPETVYAYGFKQKGVLPKLLNTFVKWIYSNTDKILVSCKGFSAKVLQYVPDKEVIYIPNWSLINSHSLTTEGVHLGEKMNFTFAGNIGKVQNLEKVIQGFHLFNKDKYSATLNIIGDGSNLAELKQLVENGNIADVKFWGRRPIEEMASFFKASDVLIISLNDHPIFELTIPSKFQAYLTAGKPIFAIINGEVKDIVLESNIGLFANPASEVDISENFKKFYEMSKYQLSSLSKSATELLNKEFNRELLIQRITDIFFA